MKKIVLLLQMLFLSNISISKGTSDAATVFNNIYSSNMWGMTETVSGPGSTMRLTVNIRKHLPVLLKRLKVTSLLDAPCGDFNWQKTINLNGIKYIGIDIVKQIIERNQQSYGSPQRAFLQLNMISDNLPKADLILCRDLLAHFPYKEIFLTIDNFKRSGAKYLLATTWKDWPKKPKGKIVSNSKEKIVPNSNIKIGKWRPLDLEKSPVNFPKPLLLIKEEEPYKHLGLWLLDSIL